MFVRYFNGKQMVDMEFTKLSEGIAYADTITAKGKTVALTSKRSGGTLIMRTPKSYKVWCYDQEEEYFYTAHKASQAFAYALKYKGRVEYKGRIIFKA